MSDQLALFARSTRHVTWPALCVRDKDLGGLAHQDMCTGNIARNAATRAENPTAHGIGPTDALSVVNGAFVVDAVTGRLNPPDPRWSA